jgi:hypothetical protein
MKRVRWQFMLAVFVGLTLVVSACSSNASPGGLPETLDKSIKDEAPEGSEIISVQQGSKSPDDTDRIKPENVWCVVTESNGTKMRWLGFYLPPEDDESAGIAMVTKGAGMDLFSKFGCTNWEGE